MSEIRVDSIGNESNTGGPVLSGITTFSGQQYFIPPKGTTAERPSGCPAGSIRFNTDSAHLEYYNGQLWLEFEATNIELGDQFRFNQNKSPGGLGVRGVWSGGRIAPAGGYSDVMDYISVSTLGDAHDFGDLNAARAYIAGGCASRTTGILYGGANGPTLNTIDQFLFASTGSRKDFGETRVDSANAGGHSNGTRGVFGGIAAPSYSKNIDYVTISHAGDSLDFGDMLYEQYEAGACGSSVRALFGAPQRSPGSYVNSVEYITISTTGNSKDFGDLTVARRITSSLSNATRGIWSGGLNPGTNVIEFMTISTLANAIDFGDLLASRYGSNGGAASPTRGVWGGGYGPSYTNVCEFITISSAGNSANFGDLTVARGYTSACSNGHGGL